MKINNLKYLNKKRKFNAFDIIYLTYIISPIYIFLLFVFTFFESILQTLLLALSTKYFIDTATDIFVKNKDFSNIYIPLFFLILVIAGINLFSSLYSLILSKIKFQLEKNLLPEIVKIQSYVKYKYIENNEFQEKIRILTTEMEETFIDGLQSYISIIRSLIGIGSIIFLLFTTIWWASIIIIFLLVPLMYISIWSGKNNYKAKIKAQKYERIYSYYSDEILCSREATLERTLFNYSDDVINRYYESFKKASDIELNVLFKTRMITKLTSISLIFVTMILAMTLINPLLNNTISSGLFVGIITALLEFSKGLGIEIQNCIKNISECKEYMEDLTLLINVEREDDLKYSSNQDFVFKTIEFINVKFKYPNSDRYILNGVSFKIENGKHYAFVGENGVGKSTITKLLTKLYDNYEGQILINDIDLKLISIEKIRLLFSIVYQDFAKYEISVKDNIILGDIQNNYSKEELDKIIIESDTYDLIKKLPNGLDTNLGKLENDSVDLSGRQWQKLAIARAIINKSPIKILDEPTSNLDPISESNLYEKFDNITKGKTSIFISHRLGSTKLADEIFVLDKGKIIQKGNHNELMKQNGLYSKMFKEQSRWFS